MPPDDIFRWLLDLSLQNACTALVMPQDSSQSANHITSLKNFLKLCKLAVYETLFDTVMVLSHLSSSEFQILILFGYSLVYYLLLLLFILLLLLTINN